MAVDFGLSSEQDQLADAERAWLRQNDPIAWMRRTLDAGPPAVDPAAVKHAAAGGLAGLLTNGIGASHVDLAVLTEAHGYAASSLPVADMAITARLLELAGLPEAAAAAEGASLFGTSVMTPERTTTPVPMAADAEAFAILQDSTDGQFVAIVRAVPITRMTTLDLTRSWGRPIVEADSLKWFPLPAGTIEHVRAALSVHRAVDALGAASRLLDMTVEYAVQRQQFGVAIGSFQAVKHHCADMVVRVEAARAVLWAAATALDSGADEHRARATAAGAAYAKAAASEVASTALQVHGGIGFTWEHDLHLLLRRIKVDEAVNGTVAEHRLALVPR